MTEQGPPAVGALSLEEISAIEDFRKRKQTAVLAIMFTDIVGSTHAAEKLGEEVYARMRHLHDELFMRCMTRDGVGTVIKQIGDSFLCVFAEPSMAVVRAVEFQRAIQANMDHLSAPGYTLSVRIGIHMGQVAVENTLQTDVFGGHVNKAARIEAQARGGEVLTSRSVWENAIGWVRAHGDLRIGGVRHGKARLRGFDEAVELFGFYAIGSKRPKLPKAVLTRKRTLTYFALLGVLVLGAAGVAIYRNGQPVVAIEKSDHRPIYVQFDFSALTVDSAEHQTILDTTAIKESIKEQIIAVFAPAPVWDEGDVATVMALKGRLFTRHDHTNSSNVPFFRDTLGLVAGLFIKAAGKPWSRTDSFAVSWTLTMFEDSGFNAFGATGDMPVADLDEQFRALLQDQVWKRDRGGRLGEVVQVSDNEIMIRLDSGMRISKGARIRPVRWHEGAEGMMGIVEHKHDQLMFYRRQGADSLLLAELVADSIQYVDRASMCGSCSQGYTLDIQGKVLAMFDTIATASWWRITDYPDKPIPGDEIRLE